jgi:hypothetical protein
MAQSRPPYAYNPDLPIRKWHQKWMNPMISLQNAPPTSHGTPAPTKEDGETGKAGFRIHVWVPMDEDDDVPEERLQEEIDWWTKPGAPIRPELRTAVDVTATSSAAPVVVVVKQNGLDEDVMLVDLPQNTTTTNDVPPATSPDVTPLVPAFSEPQAQREAVPAASPNIVSTKSQSPPPQDDLEMTNAPLSPVHLSTVPDSPSVLPHHSSPPTINLQSPSPIPPPPSTDVSKSPTKSPVEPAIMEDILGTSKASPPSDHPAQEKEVVAGLTIESATEKAENTTNAARLSDVGDGVKEIVGNSTEDLWDSEDVVENKVERTEEETNPAGT